MGGGMPQMPAPPAEESKDIVNINDLIDTSKSECQNLDSGTPLVNVFMDSDSFVLKSDCDEQLLFNLYFQSTVKIHHLVLRAPDLETAPLNIKIFINKCPMSFDDMDAVDPVEELEIQEGELEGDIILNFVKYQSVSNLTLFIENNRDGGDVTQVSKLEIHGASLLESDMKNLKKVGCS
ncbi:unnamed protein product [Moneuplotes crassus]|uniref:PITH domain-containing protein n=1 Tax=Euplotes crassus TaxID=5936 RepID=A0AAD1XVP3_EUPCR|nr:unnamed protein product [Moneuplotes crassus]